MAFTTHLSVLDGLRRNDDIAWDRFFHEYRPLLRLHGRDCGVPEDRLDDLGQEVLLVLTRHGSLSFDAAKGSFRCFLRGIIRNKAHEFRRRQNRDLLLEKQFLLPEYGEEEPEASDTREWTEQAFHCGMAALRELLPPLHFQAFDLLVVRSWEPQKVAFFLNMPLPTVYSIRTRTMSKLKQLRPILKEKCK